MPTDQQPTNAAPPSATPDQTAPRPGAPAPGAAAAAAHDDAWNGAAGANWVASQALLDELFRPIEHALARTASAHRGGRLLDVGCGTGATTVAAAEAVGSGGHVLGVDVSQPMIDAARRRAVATSSSAEFVVADATAHPFPPGSFDLIASRFGVMFFADPVGAFAHLHAAAAAGGSLEVVTWRAPEANPFMTAAERAAAHVLPELPERRAGEPGQFGLADAGDVQAILAAAGWDEPSLEPLDVDCAMPLTALEAYATRLGPVGHRLASAPAAIRAAVLPVVLDAFAPYVSGDEVRFTAACWTVRARRRG